MDSIMPVFKKSELYWIFFLMPVITCMLFAPSGIQAQSPGITIDHFDGSVDKTMLNINATISYHLSKETTEALDHGVPLEFDIKLRIKKIRKWIWDETVTSGVVTYKIEYQPLSNQYLVTGIQNGDIEQFQNLEEVLQFIGKLKHYPLADINMISPEHHYVAQIKSTLNIQALPAPLRPLAYLSSQWRLSSHWQSWAIQL